MHIAQGMQMLAGSEKTPVRTVHPIELFACAYGIEIEGAGSVGR
jgi:hypothetical protein